MKNSTINRTAAALLCSATVLAASTSWAAPLALSLYAKAVTNTLPGGVKVPMWGFATTPNGTASVPGPQIDVGPGQYADGLVITVFNQLPEPISVVIPGLNGSADAGQPVTFDAGDPDYANRVRSLVPEVAPGGSRAYNWTGPLNPGTYIYHSGTHPAVQVQMGLHGMVTVKQVAGQAYPGVSPSTEVSVIFSEVDPLLHWAVATNGYGPGKTISSTIHSEPSYFLINGQAYDTTAPPAALLPSGQAGQTTLFRLINACWDLRIPVVGGPGPAAEDSYVTVVAEDGKPYPYARTLYAPDLPALKTKDALFTPPAEGSYRIYDRKLGLSNGSQSTVGGMIRLWGVAAASVAPVLEVSPSVLNFVATAGGPNPAGQQFLISNGGDGTLNWTATVTPGSPWLNALPGAGSGNGNVTVSANIAGLTAGPYSGSVNVSDPAAGGSPQTVTVNLQVNAGASPPTVGIARLDTRSAFGFQRQTTHPLTGVPAGALLVLTTGAEHTTANAAVSSSPALTWTKRVDAREGGTGDRANAEIYTAVFPAGGSITVNSSWGFFTPQSSVCYVVTNFDATLGGASALAPSQSAPSVPITTTRARSILICVSLDRNAQSATAVYRDSATQALSYRATGTRSSRGYHYCKMAPTIGGYTEGLTSPTGQTAATAVLEIRSQP